jgi:hypothetical protein
MTKTHVIAAHDGHIVRGRTAAATGDRAWYGARLA